MGGWVERYAPDEFRVAAEWSEGVAAALDDIWLANNLATMALSDRAFAAYQDASKLAGMPPAALIRQTGMAGLLRERLCAMGWQAPT